MMILVTVALLAACGGKTQESTGAASGTTAAPVPAGKASAAKPPDEKPAGTPVPGGPMAVGLAAETDSFSPYSGTWSISSYTVANALYDPLLAIDDRGVPHAYLAQDVVPTGDLKEWVIKLRPGVTFHDGEALDAAAVKKNLDTGRRSGLTAQAFTDVASVDVVDPLTVSVKMNQPWATFPASLTMQPGYMAAPAMLDDPAGAAARPIGTGPFVFQDRQRDASLRAKRNPNYWQKDAAGVQLPYLDSIEFKVLTDSSTRRNALKAGDIDSMVVVTPDTYVSSLDAARAGELQMITDAGAETDETIFAMNTSKPPFDDPLARQVLAYGIDQQEISATAYQNAFPAAWGMFDEDSQFYISREEAGYPAHNLETARALAQEYQRKHGAQLEFTMYVPSDAQYLAIGQLVQAQATNFGVKINLQAIEQSQMITKVVATGDYQASGFVLWSAPTPDRAYVFLATKANPTGLSLNFSRFDDPEITAAMNDFRAILDPQKRIEDVKTVQKSLAKNMQVLFLVHNRSAFVYSNAVHGAHTVVFAGTDRPATAPYPTTPFWAGIWRDRS
jgi:peptide/nickel transport system substrate-binding protein